MATATEAAKSKAQPPSPATGQATADWLYPKPRGTSALTPEQRAALQATPAATAKATPPTPKATPAQAKPEKTHSIAFSGNTPSPSRWS
jgi:hypothetical protein